MDSCELYKLPFDILQQIAAYLHDTDRSSLYAFGAASKTCHKSSLRFIFREVHIEISDPKSVHFNITRLLKVLSDAESTQYVRQMNLKGFLFLNLDGRDRPRNEMRPLGSEETDYFKLSGVGEVLGDEEPYLAGGYFPDEAINVSPEEDAAWAPIVQFAEKLSNLTKLVYKCRNQFPPSLLNAIHEHHPHCKLHHLTFRFRSLRNKARDLHEMAIATSPCLHTVQTLYAWRDSNGEDDYNEDAMQELVAGLAPNLKELRTVKIFLDMSLIKRRNIDRQPWRSFQGFVPGDQIGLLTSLSMECMAQNNSLPRLKRLRIRLDRGEREIRKPNYVHEAVNFFTTLEPLQELIVDGPFEPEMLSAILSKHGPRLRKLSLRPFESQMVHGGPYYSHIPMLFEKRHALQIQEQCPMLQELAIAVKRTMSDAQEAEMYRTFGRFERLQKLFLTLDCSNWEISQSDSRRVDPSWDVHDLAFNDDNEHSLNRILRKGHLREAFINSAVDETLARSIWTTICENKAGKRLKSLKLYPTGGGSFNCYGGGPCNERDTIVKNLSRFWLIERSVRDDDDSIKVTELGRAAREARDKIESDFYNMHYKGDRTGALLPPHSAMHIFRRIWPMKEDSIDWRLDWESFPLHGSPS